MGAFTLGTIAALSLLAAALVQAHQCGQRPTIDEKLISNDNGPAQAGAWPWHGAMFQRVNSSVLPLCAVTILTETFVLTAADCTIDHRKKLPLQAKEVFVKVGAERYSEQHDVVMIIPHEQFNNKTLENNIALMELKTGITYNDYVLPICLWQGSDSILSPEGYVVGYSDDDEMSTNLNKTMVSVVSKEECIDSDPERYFESKTFCGEYGIGTKEAGGHSGGGLFVRDGITWFIRGIISTIKYDTEAHEYVLDSYVIFSNVSNYVCWMREHVNLADSFVNGKESSFCDNKEPETTNKTTVIGEKTSNTEPHQCGQKQLPDQHPMINGSVPPARAWPWHGALFHRDNSVDSYACGVTILSETFVITTAECTIDRVNKQLLPEDRVFVMVGVTKLDGPEKSVQQCNVTKIIRHEEDPTKSLENSVALLQLSTGITFNDYVQPICLDDTDLEKIVSPVWYIVGWEHSEDNELPTELKESKMLIASRERCHYLDQSLHRSSIVQFETFCADYRNKSIVAGDSGSGLYLQQGNIWILRGIFSNVNIDPNATTVDTEKPLVFVDAANYVEWIETQMKDAMRSTGHKTVASGYHISLIILCGVWLMLS